MTTESTTSVVKDRWQPFIRTDFYGEGGARQLPVWEQLRLLFTSITLLPIRFFAALACVTTYYICVRLITILPITDIIKRRTITVSGKIWCRLCLYVLGFVSIRWVTIGALYTERSNAQEHGYVAIVSNHLGWADILLHMARWFPSFVARDGTQDLPMVGMIR